MSSLLKEKIEQATRFVVTSDLDAWLIFVRETAESGDPVLPFLLEGSLTWVSALIFSQSGKRLAVVGRYDGDPLEASGDWHEVIRYDRNIRSDLLAALEICCGPTPKIGINFSINDEKCDGLTHGMYLLLKELLQGTRFENSLISAEQICMSLRGQKTQTEIERMKSAISEGDAIFNDIQNFAKVGITEREVYDQVHRWIRERGLGFSWAPAGDPIVNSGPNSMIGHGVPSEQICIETGHVFHIDLGVINNGYSSDIQRSWYVGEEVPDDVQTGFDAVRTAILAGFSKLRPGVSGWEVDEAARLSIVAAGFAEYMHALGHQVGRVAHDGGALLGPKWERYGDRPIVPISEGEVYTLELGVVLPGRGYLGLEEMVQVTEGGAEWLSTPQTQMWLLK